MKHKKQKPVDAIAQLIRGDLNTPLGYQRGGKDGKILAQLETLRCNLAAMRDNYEQEKTAHDMELASVAHDLKTPLSVISGYAECIQDGIDDKDYSALILEKTMAMNEQIIGLVEATRLKTGEDEKAKCEHIESRAFLSEEIDKYSALANSKNQILVKKKFANARFYACKADISRVLQNIITNAIKYTPEGGTIKVRAKRLQFYIKISVTDSGIGISRKDLRHVFEKFYMAEKSRTDAKSSGLGLHIAREKVVKYGGDITVKSKEGKYTTFNIFLPIERDVHSGTAVLDAMSREGKFFLWFFSGFVLSAVYRFIRYGETRRVTTLIAAFIFIPLFFVGWFADLCSALISNKITLLAE